MNLRLQHALCLAVGLMLVQTTFVFAHMTVEKSEPAANSVVASAPKQLQIWFSQKPDPKVSKLTLRGPAASIQVAALQSKDKSLTVAIPGQLTDGVYTASWQAAGTDGHVQKGEFRFTLKQSR